MNDTGDREGRILALLLLQSYLIKGKLGLECMEIRELLLQGTAGTTIPGGSQLLTSCTGTAHLGQVQQRRVKNCSITCHECHMQKKHLYTATDLPAQLSDTIRLVPFLTKCSPAKYTHTYTQGRLMHTRPTYARGSYRRRHGISGMHTERGHTGSPPSGLGQSLCSNNLREE